MMEQLLNTSLHNSSSVQANGSCQRFGDTSSIKVIKILGYILILVFSLSGNSVIITTVMRDKKMQTATNYLIANVAASDLLISTIAVPMKLCEIVVGPRRWLINGMIGSISCKLAYFLQDNSTTVSVVSLVVIAIDRYRGIAYPFRPAIVTCKRCKLIIPLIWLSSMALYTIYFYLFRLSHNTHKGKTLTYCTPSWEPAFHSHKAQELYTIILLVSNLIFPFFISTILYSGIVWNLRNEKLTRQLSAFSRRRRKENAKVLKYIAATLITFYLCIFPIFASAILFIYVYKFSVPCKMEQFAFAAHFVLFSNAAITPLIVFAFNDRYRKRLKEALKTLIYCHTVDPINLAQEDFELNELQPEQ